MKTFKDIAKLNTLAEAKLLLLLMKTLNIKEASLSQLSDYSGLALAEVALGAGLLKAVQVNKSKGFDSVLLDDEWLDPKKKSL